MDFSATPQPLARDLETALTGLVKLTKALSFYPPDHPALIAAAAEAGSDFQPLLKHHDTRPYHVTREGFTLDAAPLAPNNQSLAGLALKLVERRVRHLLFLPEMANHELLMFAEELIRPAAELFSAGGFAKRLAERQIGSIWINETNLKAILGQQQHGDAALPTAADGEQQQGTETSFTAPGADPQDQRLTATDKMRELLEQLKEPQNTQTYKLLLARVRQLAQNFFRETGIVGLLAVLGLLENHRKDRKRKESQRQMANELIDALLTELTRKTLVDAIAEQSLKASQQRSLVRLMTGLGSKVAPQLLKRLYAERDAIIRRRYSDILASMGEPIFELLKKDLQTDTWHQVRNVVTILGKTQLESSLPLLAQVIDHPEVRVRRSAIRALGAIGGSPAVPLLARLANDTDEELHQPAIMALGALKNSRAIPPLVAILKKSDPFGKQTLLKTETIQALAATGSPQAIIPLLKLARKSNLLNRKAVETLRAEATLALGQLGNAQLIPVLERLPRRDKDPLSRALKQAIDQLKKQHVA